MYGRIASKTENIISFHLCLTNFCMKKLFLLLVAVLSIGLCASAQTRTVKGTVVDAANGEPLISASVKAAGSATGVATDVDGDFSIVVPASTRQLVVTYVGYQTQNVDITDGKLMIRMVPQSTVLDDFIAVAYGTVKKSEYTGSASVVKADQLEDALVTTATSALTGRVAGVQTLSNNGQPGEQPSVMIRGVGSINASTQPLYVVDGVPYNGDLATIPTTDIEAMTVLKDAASTALYGARGANGVILITTKRGAEGEARVTLDARWGHNSRALGNYDVITDPRQYLEQVYAAHYMTNVANYGTVKDENGINHIVMSPELAASSHQYALGQLWPSLGYQTWTAPAGQSIIGTDGKFNPNATPGYVNNLGYYLIGDDWSDIIGHGLRQEYNLSVSGGNDRLTYYFTGSYLSDEGLIEGSHYQRLNTRIAVDYQVKKWLKLGANVAYTYVNSGYPGGQTDSGNSTNAFYMANFLAPVYPIYQRDSKGDIMYNTSYGKPIYDYGDNQVGEARNVMSMSNPIGDLAYNLDESLMDILDSKWYALLTPVKGLTINANLGYFVDNTRNHSIANGLYGQLADQGGQAMQVASRLRTINAQFLAEYQRTFNDVHNAALMLGYESYSLNSENVQAIGNNLYNPGQWAVSNTIDQRNGYGSSYSYATRGFFLRAKYNYAERYFLMGSFRRDASSRFHPDHRWGNFWSASVAWEIAKESFMQDFDNVDMLKFKFSYGQNGNDNLLNYYPYLDQYRLTGADGVFNDAQLTYKGNPDITWETSNNINVGFDFSFFKGMLFGTAEYYQRKVTDMLFNIPVAPSLGYSTMPMNVGSMRNNGFEIELNYRPVNTKDITVDIFANLTLPQNKVLELAPDILNANGDWINGNRIFHEGESMYQFYITKYAGVDPETGLALYWARKPLLDENEEQISIDGILQWGEEYTTTNATDARTSNRVKTGNLMPKGYGGFGASVKAYGFDFAINFSYQFGGKVYDNTYVMTMGTGVGDLGLNMHKDLLNAWTPENRYTDVPRLSTSDQYTTYFCDRFLKSSDYLALNNITVGYTIPENITKKAFLHNVRVYFSAENVALWSKRKGLDPRQSFTATGNYVYSPIRCFSGGIRLSF